MVVLTACNELTPRSFRISRSLSPGIPCSFRQETKASSGLLLAVPVASGLVVTEPVGPRFRGVVIWHRVRRVRTLSLVSIRLWIVKGASRRSKRER